MLKRTLVTTFLIVALPTICLAGAVTSRWDMNIGGYIAFDVGWADQSVTADYQFPERDSGKKQNVDAEYGTQYWAIGQTRLSFDVKGPSLWGAKTGAYIEGDFRGALASRLPANNGIFGLRRGYMTFTWPRTYLLIGHDWQAWGQQGGYTLLAFMGLTPFLRGVRSPQITLKYKLTEEFTVVGSLMYPTSQFNSYDGANVVNDYTRNWYPHIQGELVYSSDAWGRAAGSKMLFAVGGFYGNEKHTYLDSKTTYDDQDVPSWMLTARFTLPIIPQKNLEHKAHSLRLSVTGGYGSNAWYMGGAYMGSYNRNGYSPNPKKPNADFVSPTAFAGFGALTYYWTDNLFSCFIFAMLQNNVSDALGANINKVGFKAPNYSTNYFLNLIWDPTPAVRLGVEYGRLYAKYPGVSPEGYKDRGTLNTGRFKAEYFF